MSKLDVVKLTTDMVNIPSVTRNSNKDIADYVEQLLTDRGFEVERQSYIDPDGVPKFNVIGRKGSGEGGLAFFSHMDTVPATGWEDEAWNLKAEPDRLIGLGACDMKGPLAATIVAADNVAASDLTSPVYIVVTADEETTAAGAQYVVEHSEMFKQAKPRAGVVAEPTSLIPVYAHKGVGFVKATAHGVAAHTSTERGVSANFLIAPFMAEMAELATELKTDPSYRNNDFDPPTLGFNMVISDGGTQGNVTAARTDCTIVFRPMPNDRSAEVMERILARANHYGLETTTMHLPALSVDPGAEIIQAAVSATGREPTTVPYGTDGFHLQHLAELVVLGPGDIKQAHTKGEWILRSQLDEAVEVYGRLIERFCQAG